MKNQLRKVSAIIATSFIVSIFASDISQPLPSLSWQKAQLEKQIVDKVEATLGRIMAKNEYTVDVAIDVMKPESPKWNETSDPLVQGNINEGSGRSTASADGPEFAPRKRERTLIATDVVTQIDQPDRTVSSDEKIKYDDVKLPKNPEAFVVFNKFGLEAPLVGEIEAEEKIVVNVGSSDPLGRSPASAKLEDELEEVEMERDRLFSQLQAARLQTQRAKDDARNMRSPTSTVEKMWKYNQAIDVYKNLTSVDILVRISESLSDEQKATAQKFVKGLNFNLGQVKPKVKVEVAKLGRDFVEINPLVEMLNIASVFGPYANFAGIVIGVLLFGFMASGLVTKYSELSQNSAYVSNYVAPVSFSEENPVVANAKSSEFNFDVEKNYNINGVERFKDFIGHSKEDAILLVKKWLKERDPNQSAALKALVQQLDNEALKPILLSLSEPQKNDWAELLEEGLTSEELLRANNFIGNQIIQNMMAPSFIKDPEVYAKIVQLKPSQFSTIVEKDFYTACMLFSVMSPNFINAALEFFDHDTQQRLINGSLRVTPAHFEKGQDRVAKALNLIEEEEQVKPFLDGLAKMIPVAGREVERLLYSNFLKEAPESRVEFMLNEYFPGFLMDQLPAELLKSIFTAYPMNKKVRLLKSLPEDLADFFLETFAPAESNAFEVIEMELEEIEMDDTLLKEIEFNKDEYWRDFMSFARIRIKSERRFAPHVNEIIENWRDELAAEHRAAA